MRAILPLFPPSVKKTPEDYDNKKGNRLFFQYSQLGNGNMAAFHHPLAYKTQITRFDRRFQVNPLRNGIGADIRELPLRSGSAHVFPSALK